MLSRQVKENKEKELQRQLEAQQVVTASLEQTIQHLSEILNVPEGDMSTTQKAIRAYKIVDIHQRIEYVAKVRLFYSTTHYCRISMKKILDWSQAVTWIMNQFLMYHLSLRELLSLVNIS
jgi:hypothetical protein